MKAFWWVVREIYSLRETLTKNFDVNSTNVTESNERTNTRTNEHTNGRTDKRQGENYIPRGINAGGIIKMLSPHFNIGIKHGLSRINVCQVPREVLKTEAKGRGFQQLPRDLANINVLENNVWSLLLNNFNERFGKICENMWHYIFLMFDSQRLSAPV